MRLAKSHITRPITATAFSFRLRLHKKAARVGGVMGSGQFCKETEPMAQVASQSPSRGEQSAAACASFNNVVPLASPQCWAFHCSGFGVPSVVKFPVNSTCGGKDAISKVGAHSQSKSAAICRPITSCCCRSAKGRAAGTPSLSLRRPKARRYGVGPIL